MDKKEKHLIIGLIIILVITIFLTFILVKRLDNKIKSKTFINNSNGTNKKNNIKGNMLLKSAAFGQNQFIPSKYTCDGQDINPPLEIKGVDPKTKSLVLIVADPDAPGGTFLHWLVFDISPKTTKIKENSIPEGGIEGKNSFGKKKYGGPCPPSGTHRYFFKLYALDIRLNLSPGTTLEEVKEETKNHILAESDLMGLYKRK